MLSRVRRKSVQTLCNPATRSHPPLRRCRQRNLTTASNTNTATDPFEYCKDLVRKHDYEGFLVSQFYPSHAKGGYFAVKAFSVELAMVQEHVSNQMIGKMRMQFWRDAVKGINEGKPPRHPIALALHQASQKANLPAYHFKRIIDARDAELSLPQAPCSIYCYPYCLFSHPPSRMQHRTSGLPKPEITAKHGVKQEDVFRHGPQAAGIQDATFDFATFANDHLITAREMFKEEGMGGKVPARAMPLFLAGVPVANYLGRLEKVNFDAFRPELQLRDWKLPWQIWRGYYRRMF
ncbi:putative squalene/phytoene synthase [Lyophyllum shimeji]|uniref:Squalene/phytoene synthase n=1 Tax=Lyophyllum shimeji TaxID=47721 RepID=A0A9P3PL48_LYOSH|nr:putative squalene/phytoene synthase [Lyophyllum shimeji]